MQPYLWLLLVGTAALEQWESGAAKFGNPLTSKWRAMPAVANQDGILELTTANFDDTLIEYPNLVVLFRDPESKASNAIYDGTLCAAHKILKDEHGIENAFAVSSDMGLTTAHSMGRAHLEHPVHALRVYASGRPGRFQGDYGSARTVALHALKLQKGACRTLTTAAEAEALTTAEAVAKQPVLIGFYGAFTGDDAPWAKTFGAFRKHVEAEAMLVTPVVCAVTESDAVSAAFGGGGGAGAGVMRFASFGALGERWMAAEALALVGSPGKISTFGHSAVKTAVTPYNAAGKWALFHNSKDRHVILVADPTKHAAAVASFKAAAVRVRAEHAGGDARWANVWHALVALPEEEDMAWQRLWVDTTDAPMVVTMTRSTAEPVFSRYNATYSGGVLNEDGIFAFSADFADNKLKAAPKIVASQRPIANFDGKSDVVDLVGANFDEWMIGAHGKGRDVLVEFYAPWCGHCKQLAPQYEAVATRFKHVPSLVIARFDASQNTIEAMKDITGFPTVKLYPANDKENPVKLEGRATTESLSGMIKDNAHVAFMFEGQRFGRGVTAVDMAIAAGHGLSDDEFDEL